MIERIILSFAVFTVIALAICNGKSINPSLNTNEDEARTFLKETSDKLFKFFDQVGDSYFRDENNTYNQRDSLKNYTIVYTKIFNDAQKFDFKNFKDPELKFAFETLIDEADLKIIGDRFLEVYDSYEELEDLSNEDLIPDRKDKTHKLAVDYDVKSITRSSNDPEELQYYWEEWRKVMGEKAAADLDLFVEAFKEAAEMTGKTPLEFWMRQFNLTDMENNLNEIQPFYMELHAFLRNLMRKRYGESVIAPDGLIPIHLYEHIPDQLLSNESIIEEIFPYDELPDVDLEKFAARFLVESAEKIFTNMGFEEFPKSLWGDRIEEIEENECYVHTWHWSQNIYVTYCEEMDYDEFLSIYTGMLYVKYAKEMVGLPAYYFNHPNELASGMATALSLSVTTSHNLKSIGLVKAGKDSDKVEMNKLARSALELFSYHTSNFVHAKVFAELLAGNITKAELNDQYWKYMKKYGGISPPKGHHTDTFDFPLHFYAELKENDMTSDFTTTVMGFQMHKKLCEIAGHYPKEPLNLCDIGGSKEAGDVLKKMMKLGHSKPFYEVYGTMFPENPTVSADGMVEYYKPLMKFLEEKNKEDNVKPGWKSSSDK